MKIEIDHPDMRVCKLFVNNLLLEEHACEQHQEFIVDLSSAQLSIWFEPWCIKPDIRLDGILVDYALANISQFDHKIDLVLDVNFAQQYHDRDLHYRKLSVFGDRPMDPYVYDAVIGHGDMHQDIVEQIRNIINA